jgi:hypothetical protein
MAGDVNARQMLVIELVLLKTGRRTRLQVRPFIAGFLTSKRAEAEASALRVFNADWN